MTEPEDPVVASVPPQARMAGYWSMGSPVYAHGPAIDTPDRADTVPVAEPVIAFRGWRIRGEHLAPLLRRDADEDWVPTGRVTARCHCIKGADGNVREPNKHQCGFYGFKTFARCTAQLSYAQKWAIGMCVFSGRIVETEFGYRAAIATPLALLDPQPRIPDDERDWLSVPLPVFPRGELIEYGRQFGFVHDQEPAGQ
jgi:hypothetical protein